MKAILLAAGFSSRMGQLKQVMALDGKPMIYHSAAPFLAAGLELIVVLGHEQERVREALDDLPCEYVVNSHPEKGMFSSVQLGCLQVGDHDGCLLSTCDCPGIQISTINAVRDTLGKSERKVVLPVFNGRRGHPAGLPAFLVKEILRLPWDTPGLNSLWREQPAMLKVLDVDDPAILRDLDRPEDLQELRLSDGASIPNPFM